ncbi:TonB-dependent siderophore receptor [Pectobacterium sp. B2J-2]|uniref:TonB-dependent siderophore receptor n=1 Tax=Pectobacterium sp. B2J-2 TaxID=3385372 RepID=UPI0038FC0B6F
MLLHQHFRLSAVLLAVSAALSATDASAQTSAAQQQTMTARSYHLNSASLADTLQAISRISGYRIEFVPEAVTGLRAGEVNGELTVSQAVTRALAGTGMSVSDVGNGILLVSQTTTLDSITVVAQRDQAEESFKADRSDTATRSGTSLMETPGSVTVVTSKVLESQQVQSIQDALANVSGVSFDESPQGKPSLSIRGFSDTSSMVNGVSDSSASLTNVFNVERIEVLKGPQAILSGANSLGGSVNVVTKKPQADALRSVQVQYGTHNDVSVAGDVTGALTEDQRLSYRLIASKADAQKSDAGYNGREDVSLMPQLRWKDENTDLIVGYSYGKQHDPLQKYTYARNGVIQPVPEMRLGNKKDGFDSEQRRAFYQLEQYITPNVTLISRLQYARTDFDLHVYNSSGLSHTTDSGESWFFPNRSQYETTETSGDHYLRFEGDTGPVSHKLSVGINHTKYSSKTQEFQNLDGSATQQISIYPPNYFPFPEVNAVTQDVFGTTDTTSEQLGTFAQNLLTYGDWNLLLNLRRSRYTTTSSSTYDFGGMIETFAEGKKKEWVTTPGIGLIYNVTPETSVYASYAEGFTPQFDRRCGGGSLEPQSSRNRELGAKFDLLDSRLSLTTAAFELQQSNVLEYDNLGDCYNTLAGQMTRGLEFDLQGELTLGWRAVINYTYSRLKDESNPDRIFTGTPKHKLSLWTTYEIQREALRGLGFGLGISAFSHANGDRRSAYAFTTPGAAQVDMSVFYNRNAWSTTLGVKNVFDKDIYEAATSNFVRVRDGRTLLLTTKYSF